MKITSEEFHKLVDDCCAWDAANHLTLGHMRGMDRVELAHWLCEQRSVRDAARWHIRNGTYENSMLDIEWERVPRYLVEPMKDALRFNG